MHIRPIFLADALHSMLEFANEEKVSTIATVASSALLDLGIVASIYRPRSVKTLVVLRLFEDTFVVKIFDCIFVLYLLHQDW